MQLADASKAICHIERDLQMIVEFLKKFEEGGE